MNDAQRLLSLLAWGYLVSYLVGMLLMMATGVHFLWWFIIGILGLVVYDRFFYPYLKKKKELEDKQKEGAN